MTKLYAKHLPYYDTGHLGVVTNEMLTRGPPTIRAMLHNNKLCALECSHRIAAAHHLVIIPKVVLEIPDTQDFNSWWDEVLKRLPEYEFPHVLILDLGEF